MKLKKGDYVEIKTAKSSGIAKFSHKDVKVYGVPVYFFEPVTGYFNPGMKIREFYFVTSPNLGFVNKVKYKRRVK